MKGSADILNPFRHGFFSLQYFSHKILRWIFIPFSFALLFLVSLAVIISSGYEINAYNVIFLLQCIFYLTVITGWILRNRRIRIKIIFMPYYLWIMNISSLMGILRYLKGEQGSSWEKSVRMT